MITSAFLTIIINAVNYLVAKLPDISISSSFVSSMTTASQYISGVYSFIPNITTAVLAIIAIDIVFESSYLLFKAVYWIIRRFPTQS